MATQVIDRFHVQQLATEAVQDIRIKYRWEAIDKENLDIKHARDNRFTYKPALFSNGFARRAICSHTWLRYRFMSSPRVPQACWVPPMRPCSSYPCGQDLRIHQTTYQWTKNGRFLQNTWGTSLSSGDYGATLLVLSGFSAIYARGRSSLKVIGTLIINTH